jgi:hypothetical protein
MLELRSSLESTLELPADLRELIDDSTLVRLIFETLHVVEQEQSETHPDHRLPIGQPRVLLTVLTYSYAAGLYGSQEIERQVLRDSQLLYLAAKASPSANELRQFRRLHRFWLQRSLSRLLKSAWQARADYPTERPLTAESESFFDWTAEQRINHSVLIDTMALDE